MKDWLFVSLGAGVQSTAMLLMYYHGKLTPMPDAAIFADTQAEPPYVYENLRRLTKIVKDKIPVLVETRGSLLGDELHAERFLTAGGKDKGKKFPRSPFFFINDEGKVGMGRRKCTQDYKIEVIRKCMRRFMGYEPRKRIKELAHQAIGISYDEWMRGKDSMIPWITNTFPLIDMKYTRTDCLRYMESLGLPEPLRSACYFCPFRSNEEWKEMQRRSPETFALAVEFDRKLREVPTYFKDQYVHRSCKPLAEAFQDLNYQPSLFETHECEGMCGV